MRLIDADALIKEYPQASGLKLVIENAPTAYDVDKVVERLENKCHNCFGAANNDCRFCEDDGK